jgi:hypothetical protein
MELGLPELCAAILLSLGVGKDANRTIERDVPR